MNAVWTHLPVLQVIVPLFGALLAGLLRRGQAAYVLASAVSWIAPVIAIALLWQVMTGGPISYHIGGWAPPWGIEYRVDLVNGYMLVLVSAVGAIIMPFAHRSVAFEIDEGRQAWFYCMYLLCLTGLLGITVTGDAFNAFVFLEISSLSTYVMIALGHDRRALVSAFQYLIMGTIGATFYVIGIGLVYLVTGTLNMADIASRLPQAFAEHARVVVAAAAFLSVGIGLKLALFPLHLWLPNAYAYAPSWATAFLAGTATKVAIYLLARVLFSIFGVAIVFRALPLGEIIIALSLAAMIVASLVAIFEDNLKRMLAYSSVAQIGYITLGLGLANEMGLTGGLIHIANHAVMKTALFLAAGAIFMQAGTMQLSCLAGLGRKMPLTAAAVTIAGFGLVGAPGTSGFISKWYLVLGAFESGLWLLGFVIVATSLIAFVYVGRVLEIIWLRTPSPEAEAARDPATSMLLPLMVLALATVYFGLDTRWTVGVAADAARTLIGGMR